GSRGGHRCAMLRPLLLLLLGAAAAQAQARSTWQPWMIGPFTKPAAANPVIAPDARATFRSPTSDSVVRWQEFATFNPAAVVREGKVYLLYRAEDASGDS